MKFNLNDSWIDDLVAIGAYLFLILALFIKQGINLIPIQIAIGVVVVALVARLVFVLFRKGNGQGRPVTWRQTLMGALYWVLLAVILGCEFHYVWIFWTLAGLFGLGAVAVRLSKK
jgi:hypothetical protein